MLEQYIFSGSLPENASTYVTREADKELYEGLKAGKFCYVLNSRQSGKSSLRVRTMQRLRDEDVACVSIDLSSDSVQDATPQQWYVGLIDYIIENFDLDIELGEWWNKYQLLSPLSRFRKFIEEVLLVEVRSNIIIFIDEIDSVLSFKFPTDDFFAFIRACHNQRVDNPEYNRLAFCLLGVASPSNLISDKNRTPFNIGQAIILKGFQPHEVEPLEKGLRPNFEDSRAVIKEILHWTGGQPFLTQKLCQFVVEESKTANPRNLEQIVKARIIENWESQDFPEHLRTIRDRILRNEERAGYLLELYQQVRASGEITNNDSIEQSELMLSGLVAKQENQLRVLNPIYYQVFNQSWIDTELRKLRPYSETFRAWVASGCKDESRLLRGKALQDAEIWASDKNISYQDRQFLAASKEKEIQEEIEKKENAAQIERERKDREATEERNKVLSQANKRARKRIQIGSSILIFSLLLTGILATKAVETGKEVTKNYDYLKTSETFAELTGKLQDEGLDTEAKELFSQSAQSVKIKEHDLRQQLLYTGIAYANLRLRENYIDINKDKNSEQAKEKIKEAKKYLDKIQSIQGNSPEALQIKILKLRTQGIFDTQNADGKNEKAIKYYQQAFNIFNQLKKQKTKNKSNISPPFNSNIQTKLLSKENVEAFHREYLKLLPDKNDETRREVFKSLKEHFFDELGNYLSNKKWKEADGITRRLILYSAGLEEQGYFDWESIQKLSCPDLEQMNQKWVDASSQRFGFSVQKRIYLETGNKLVRNEAEFNKLYNEENYILFGKSIGWYNQNQGVGVGGWWRVEYNQLVWRSDMRGAPVGHLPAIAGVPVGVDGGRVLFSRARRWRRRVLFSRVATCKL
ncbi:TPR repeat-containing protein [Calothrix sp. NIES-4105]|nr:TPR repeat-containing protein [Calothrix sp. NIES-4105]